jgi:hypothetical protein
MVLESPTRFNKVKNINVNRMGKTYLGVMARRAVDAPRTPDPPTAHSALNLVETMPQSMHGFA